MLNYIAIDLQLYKIFKVMWVSIFLGQTVHVGLGLLSNACTLSALLLVGTCAPIGECVYNAQILPNFFSFLLLCVWMLELRRPGSLCRSSSMPALRSVTFRQS